MKKKQRTMEKCTMPKNRKRVVQAGAKSRPVLTKFKIGGRKSGLGVKQMSSAELARTLTTVSKRDRNKLIRALEYRGLV